MPAINASAQAGTVWSIRNLLVTAVALLALFGIGISGYVLRTASLERATASDAASVNEAADMLLESAGQWARERGATNLALNTAEAATDAQKAPIANFRKAGDQPFVQALDRMSIRQFANKDQLIAGAKRAHEQLAALRARADAELAKPAGSREKAVVSHWAPTITALIVASQESSRCRSDGRGRHPVAIVEPAKSQALRLDHERVSRPRARRGGGAGGGWKVDEFARNQQPGRFPRSAGGRLGLRAGVCRKIVGAAKCLGGHRARARERVPAVRGNPQGRLCGGTRWRQLST